MQKPLKKYLSKNLPYLIVILIVIVWRIDRCGLENKIYNQIQTIDDYRDTAIMVGKYIAKNNALEITNEALGIVREKLKKENRIFSDQIDLYKKNGIKFISTTKTELSIKEVKVIYHDTLPCVFTKKIVIDSQFYLISQTFTNKDLVIDSLIIPDEQLTIVGDMKGNWFKSPTYEITTSHTNPYITTTGIKSYNLQTKKPWVSLGPEISWNINPFTGNSQWGIGISIQKPMIQLNRKIK